MNVARIALAAVVAWVVSLGIGYLVNLVLFKDLLTLSFGRPEADVNAMLPIGFVALLIGFFAFAYAFAKGYEGTNGVMEGIRFGVLIAIMADCFAVIWNYITLPISATQLAFSLIDPIVEMAIYGAIVGAIYKPLEKPARTAARV